MKLEIDRMLVLSTAHMHPDDSSALDETVDYQAAQAGTPTACDPNMDGRPAVARFDYGWIVQVLPALPDMESDEDMTADWGWASETLRAAVRLARQHECAWIRLDQDGPEISELPTETW